MQNQAFLQWLLAGGTLDIIVLLVACYILVFYLVPGLRNWLKRHR